MLRLGQSNLHRMSVDYGVIDALRIIGWRRQRSVADAGARLDAEDANDPDTIHVCLPEQGCKQSSTPEHEISFCHPGILMIKAFMNTVPMSWNLSVYDTCFS